MSNILFYSDKCQYSMMFIKKLHDENMLQEFKLINILELKEIPPMITNIPTIIVKNINVPLTGIKAFAWLENSKYFYQQTNNINNKVNQININQDNSISNDKTNNKKTDDFANLKDEDDDKVTKTKFNGATQNISITNINDIRQTVSDQKLSQDIQIKRLNELMMVRKMQISSIINNNDNTSTVKNLK